MILTLSLFSFIAVAGDENDPEIEDDIEDDVIEYLDIISAWFYEQADQPDFLFVGLKLNKISSTPLKQHLTVHWDYNGVPCATMMAVGYQGFESINFSAGWGHGFWFQEHYEVINGDYDQETGIITMSIPKHIIKDPQKGDILTDTYALTFQRFGFIGRMGFDRPFIHSILFRLSGQRRGDIGPNDGYGRDYTIQY